MSENICSCVVQTRPGYGERVAARLDLLPGVEVHAGVGADKLILTIEDTSDTSAADSFTALADVPDVINTILIYHYGGDDLEPRA